MKKSSKRRQKAKQFGWCMESQRHKLQEQKMFDHICHIPDSHGERIDIFIKSIKKEDCLNHHIVNPVDIEFDFCPAVTVPKTKLSFLQISRLWNWKRGERKFIRRIISYLEQKKIHIKTKAEEDQREMQTFRSFKNLSKCSRTPRSSSRINSPLSQGILVTSWMCDPILVSAIPNLNFDFLTSLTFGRLSSRKLLNSSVISPEFQKQLLSKEPTLRTKEMPTKQVVTSNEEKL